MYFQDHVINNNVIERSFNNGCKIWMHKDVKYVENIIECTFWFETKPSWQQHAEDLIEFFKNKDEKYDWQLGRRHKWSRGYLKGLSFAIFF